MATRKKPAGLLSVEQHQRSVRLHHFQNWAAAERLLGRAVHENVAGLAVRDQTHPLLAGRYAILLCLTEGGIDRGEVKYLSVDRPSAVEDVLEVHYFTFSLPKDHEPVAYVLDLDAGLEVDFRVVREVRLKSR